MSQRRRSYRTNSSHLSEFTRKVAECSVSIHFSPESWCSACGSVCRSIPFVIYDGYNEIICDSCADALSIPALRLKRLFEESLQIFEGNYEISPDIAYYWRVAFEKKPNLRIDFHTRALIETICDRGAAYGLNQIYLVSLRNTPPLIRLTSTYHDEELLDKSFEKAEADFLRILETGQNEDKHIEYFYMVDAMHYPPGLNPGKREEIEPDLPSWKWPFKPEE